MSNSTNGQTQIVEPRTLIVDGVSAWRLTRARAQRLDRKGRPSKRMRFDYTALLEILAEKCAPIGAAVIFYTRDFACPRQAWFDAAVEHAGYQPVPVDYRQLAGGGMGPLVAHWLGQHPEEPVIVVSNDVDLAPVLLKHRASSGGVSLAFPEWALHEDWGRTGVLGKDAGVEYFDLAPYASALIQAMDDVDRRPRNTGGEPVISAAETAELMAAIAEEARDDVADAKDVAAA